MDGDESGALDRVARGIGGMEVVERLAALSGSDFASVMLEVVRRRAARETPASVLRRYRHDRFVRPGSTSWRSGRRAEDILLGCLPADVAVVTLAPIVPVRLAATQRVVRAQRFPAGWSAHFGLFAMVTAGRDEGSCRFEQAVLAEQLLFAVAGLRAAELPRVQVALTPLSEAGERIAAAAAAELAATSADTVIDRDRAAGHGYYRDVCFKVNALVNDMPAEIGDGGFTDWTARLLASRKERLLISGYSLDRLAALIDGQESAADAAQAGTASNDPQAWDIRHPER